MVRDPVSSVGSITIRQSGEQADRLVSCLRAKAQSYSLGMEEASGEIMVVDRGGHADNMRAFLQERLDACARDLGFDWRAYLAIQ
jgi:hypothetical protein